jgi:hypothetical protein
LLDNGERYALVAEPGLSAVFSLNLPLEMSADEVARYDATFDRLGDRSEQPATDDVGRPSTLWSQSVTGVETAGELADAPIDQLTRWWVNESGHVTQWQYVNSVAGVGTGTVTVTEVSADALSVAEDFFSTAGLSPLQVLNPPVDVIPPPSPGTSSP